MRHNPKHAVTDPATVRRLIAENPWATIVSNRAAGWSRRTTPCCSTTDADDLAVVTHVGRPDEQVHGFGRARCC